MKIAVVERGVVSVIALQGDFVIGAPETAFSQAIRDLLDRHRNLIVVDFAGIGNIDSSGIDALVSGMTSCLNAGGRMSMARLTARVKKLFEITRLDSIFDIHSEVDGAVGKLQTPA
jgi:anti-sigma B factor antagonist